MTIKFDHYVASLFKQSSLLFDNKKGILYYRNKSNKLQELPNQSRNLMKLRKILDVKTYQSCFKNHKKRL